MVVNQARNEYLEKASQLNLESRGSNHHFNHGNPTLGQLAYHYMAVKFKRINSSLTEYGDEIAREGYSTQYNLILEYCSGKTIADLIEDNHGELLESEAKVFARDVLSGLTYIHDRNIVHCDIKPDNLLLSPTAVRFRSTGYLTKIGDFGLAMEKGSVEYGNGYGHKRGTTRYMAPELIGHGFVDFGADVWAFGCTVLEMLSGATVWGEYGDLAFDDWVDLIGHSDRMPHVPAWLSKEALDFLSRCLERDVNKRWSTLELKNHPFVLL
ncbi:hypothetical protein YC2023_070956 [Brassica napus]